MPETLTREQKERKLHLKRIKEKRSCRNYYNYFKKSWRRLEPSTPLSDNWHYPVLCSELQLQAERIAAGERKEYDLIINVPPRTLKSTIGTMAWPTWTWTEWPHIKFLTASYSGDLATEHSVKSRRLIQSNWYQMHWGDKFNITTDQNVKSHYENDKTGARIATSVGGVMTGQGGDIIIVDDPLSVDGSRSETVRKTAISWMTGTLTTRLNDPKVGMVVIIMQRLHEEDPTGHMLKIDGEDYKHICLPGEESEDISPPELRRFYLNGMLFPTRLDEIYLDTLKRKMTPFEYAGQVQQRPSPEEGGYFKKWWWRYWVTEEYKNLKPVQAKKPDGTMHICPQRVLPKVMDNRINSWDFAFKDLETNDYVAGHHWAARENDAYLVDMRHGHFDFVKTCEQVRDLEAHSNNPSAVYYEDKANGPAVKSSMEKEMPKLEGVEPRGSKEARAMPYSKKVSRGEIWIPHPDMPGYDWVKKEFLHEHSVFNKGKTDDHVDAGSQGIDKLFAFEKIWPDYKPENLRLDKRPIRRSFQVQWNKLGPMNSTIYCALYMEKDYSMYGLFTVWDHIARVLIVHKELVVRNPTVTNLVPTLKKFAMVNRSARLFGNKPMFGENKSVRELLARQKIRVRENLLYDEQRAIMVVNYLFRLNMVIVHEDCVVFDRQVRDWEIVKGVPGKKNAALCYCLANIVSALREKGKLGGQKIPKAYTKKRSEARTRLKEKELAGDGLGQASRRHEDFLLG